MCAVRVLGMLCRSAGLAALAWRARGKARQAEVAVARIDFAVAEAMRQRAAFEREARRWRADASAHAVQASALQVTRYRDGLKAQGLDGGAGVRS